jgi:glutaminase
MKISRPLVAAAIAEAIEGARLAADRGKLAAYIPELARADISKLAIAVCLDDGEIVTAGAGDEPVTIQSVSKVFVLALALGKVGDRLWRRVGREPSGSAFDSILQLEHENGVPRNPFINAGALVVCDSVLSGHEPKETLGEILQFVRFLAEDDSIFIDHRVAGSEAETGYRNRSLAHYLKSCGNLDNPVDLTLGVYFHQCAIAMTATQLAKAGRFLAFGGKLSRNGPCIIPAKQARRINALMLTCGHYNGSGEFAFRVGIPGKSGVSGVILATIPDVASVAVWAPGLDVNGNSLLGTRMLESLVSSLNWSVFV